MGKRKSPVRAGGRASRQPLSSRYVVPICELKTPHCLYERTSPIPLMQEYATETQLAIYKHNLAIVEKQLQESPDQEARRRMESLKEDLSKKIKDLQDQLPKTDNE